jgi:serine/threonine-protein kinase
VPEIARDLKVDAVMEGSVLKAGTQIRIDVKLIDAAEDRQIWARQYERGLENILVLQSEVVRDIARRIKIAVTPEERKILASYVVVNPDAHEAYLRGKHLLNQLKPEVTFQAVEYFQTAIDIDSTYAPGYLGLAQSYAFLGYSNTLPFKETWPKTRAMAEKALNIDQTLAEAHAVLALALIESEYSWKKAEAALQTALDLNPNSAQIHMWYARLLYHSTRRFEEARTHIETAQKLDPFSLEAKYMASMIEVACGNLKVGLRMAQELQESNPDHPVVLWILALFSAMQKRYEQSIEYLKESIHYEDDYISDEIALLSYLYARTGQHEKALSAHEQLETLSAGGLWISPVIRSFYYIGSGDKEGAIDWIEMGYETRDAWMKALKTFFIFESLRDHPRFLAILKKMGLDP